MRQARGRVMQAERAVGCPGDAAAVPPTEHVGAMGATYEAAETRSVEKGRAVSPGATPPLSLLPLMYAGTMGY